MRNQPKQRRRPRLATKAAKFEQKMDAALHKVRKRLSKAPYATSSKVEEIIKFLKNSEWDLTVKLQAAKLALADMRSWQELPALRNPVRQECIRSQQPI